MVLLCGMFTHHLTEDGEQDAVNRHGVGVVLPSTAIQQALFGDTLTKHRKLCDEKFPLEKPRVSQASRRVKPDEPRVTHEELMRDLIRATRPDETLDPEA